MKRCALSVVLSAALVSGGCTYLVVDSDPPGAIWVLSKSGTIGKAGSTVRLPASVFATGSPQTDKLVLFKQGYEEAEVDVTLVRGKTNGTNPPLIAMQRNTPTLAFLSEPSGATVRLQVAGKEGSPEFLGTTPFAREFHPPLKDGDTLRWEKSDYIPVTRRVTRGTKIYQEVLYRVPVPGQEP